jgi:histidyl-tRNA synthetase
VIIIGATEREAGQVTVRDMGAGKQFTCALDEVGRLLSEVKHD